MSCDRSINIVVASDQNYAPHLETLIVSIGENNRNVESIRIHIMDNGLDESSRIFIECLTDKYRNIHFQFYELREDTINELLGGCVENDRSLSTYARLFIPKMINSDRALYLDVDAIVCADLTDLYFTDMRKFAIAGVLDTNPISRHRNVGLKDNEPYICAGMILFNLKKCREINFTEQCISFVKRHNGNVDAMDQGTINGVCGCKGLIKIIHPKHDVLTSLYQLNSNQIKKVYSLQEYYSDKEIIEARKDPVFLHFTPNMTTRPWVEHCKHPLKEEYWRYRQLTEYSEKILQKDNRKLKMRILGFIYRNFPSLYARATVSNNIKD